MLHIYVAYILSVVHTYIHAQTKNSLNLLYSLSHKTVSHMSLKKSTLHEFNFYNTSVSLVDVTNDCMMITKIEVM